MLVLVVSVSVNRKCVFTYIQLLVIVNKWKGRERFFKQMALLNGIFLLVQYDQFRLIIPTVSKEFSYMIYDLAIIKRYRRFI